jgi:uncharacterized membrane protein
MPICGVGDILIMLTCRIGFVFKFLFFFISKKNFIKKTKKKKRL